jgi:hypothetical protein
MKRSYAVTWSEPDRPAVSGRLHLGPTEVVFDGGTNGTTMHAEVPFSEVAAVTVARSGEARLDERPTLVLSRRGAPPVRIASVASSWIIPELADRLAEAHAGRTHARKTLALVVPIRPESREAVRELVRRGPPFDPGSAELLRHDVFLTDSEAVFTLELGPGGRIESLFDSQGLWLAAEEWLQHLDGPARVAEPTYLWPADG